MSTITCFLLFLLLVTPPALSLSSTPPTSFTPPSSSHQRLDPFLGQRVYARKAFDCEDTCKSSSTAELCILECVSPDCVAEALKSMEMDDMSNPDKSLFHQTVRKCALEALGKEYEEKFGTRMKASKNDL